MTPPRATLMTRAPGLILANASSLKMCCAIDACVDTHERYTTHIPITMPLIGPTVYSWARMPTTTSPCHHQL